MMLIDLGRNDVGRVAEPGNVCVPREGLGYVDVLRASFPAGTVSGAPKIRALFRAVAHAAGGL